jgi:hypothetical protein
MFSHNKTDKYMHKKTSGKYQIYFLFDFNNANDSQTKLHQVTTVTMHLSRAWASADYGTQAMQSEHGIS